MTWRDEVLELLRGIESEIGKIRYFVSTPQMGIGEVQIIVYLARGEAQVKIFNLHDGLTPSVEKEIRNWFEPLVRAEGA